MNFNEFRKMVGKWPVVFSRDVVDPGGAGQGMRNQLERWRKLGLVIRLRKGVYMLGDDDRRVEAPRAYLANQLYGPSYVSLEYALGYYGLIPERVEDVTSVTVRKTARVVNDAGTFTYRHISREGYRGFVVVKGGDGIPFFIAEPEKALVDLMYLELRKFDPKDPGIFEDSYRLQNISRLDPKKMIRYSGLFDNKKLFALVKAFTGRYLKEGKRTA